MVVAPRHHAGEVDPRRGKAGRRQLDAVEPAARDQRLQRHHQRAAGERRRALVRRVAGADRRRRQPLPQALPRTRQPVDEAVGVGPEVADAVRPGQRGDVQQHAGSGVGSGSSSAPSRRSLGGQVAQHDQRVRRHGQRLVRPHRRRPRPQLSSAIVHSPGGSTNGCRRGLRVEGDQQVAAAVADRALLARMVRRGVDAAGEGVLRRVVPVVRPASRGRRASARRRCARRRAPARARTSAAWRSAGSSRRSAQHALRRRPAARGRHAAQSSQPSRVVLAVGVVVALLAVADLVAGAAASACPAPAAAWPASRAHARRVR